MGQPKCGRLKLAHRYPNAEAESLLDGFVHFRGGILRLYLEGVERSVGVTDTHHIYSADRNEFIPAGKLQIGETLQLKDRTTRITAIEQEVSAQTIYSLEVHGEHVFRVTNNGLSVHYENWAR